MANPLVSIIMPVYGVEDYVGRAIESLQSQTYETWELFCVDDGSKDNSGTICEEYAFRDDRITVIHKENGGAPSARNVAIDKVRGDYIYFMDADDWAEATMLADMVDLAETNNAQMVITGFYIDTFFNDTARFQQEQSVPSVAYASQQEFREDAYRLLDQNLLYTPWNKLFRADYILENGFYFPQTFWDDFPFVLYVIKDIERVVVSGRKYYHFIRQRKESETARYREGMFEKRLEEDQWISDMYHYWNIMTPEVQEFLDRRHAERLFGCLENVVNKQCTLSLTEKGKAIREILQHPRTKSAVKGTNPRSKYMRIMLIPLRWGLVFPVYVESKVISFVKTNSTKLFAVLKAGR